MGRSIEPQVVSDSPWIDRVRPVDRTQVQLRLFCFPCAGGSTSMYRSWRNEISPGVEICALQLPGRGGRFSEPPFRRLEPLVSALAEHLERFLDVPCAFFGHSMGALVAFELAREFSKHAEAPIHLIVSGLRAPQLLDRNNRLHDLPQDELLAALISLNGVPDQLSGEPEFLKLMLPTLRADLELCETYAYRPGPPLPCRISAYTGRDDPRCPAEDLIFWRAHTASEFSCRIFPGDHFFIESARRAVLSALSIDLIGTLIKLNQPPKGDQST